jgi:hypothetical protein
MTLSGMCGNSASAGSLDQGLSPHPFNRPEAGGAVIQHAGENHTDNAGAVTIGGGAKQGVDGRAEPIFFRSFLHKDLFLLDQQVMIGRRYVDHIFFHRFAITRMPCFEPPGAAQDLGKNAR